MSYAIATHSFTALLFPFLARQFEVQYALSSLFDLCNFLTVPIIASSISFSTSFLQYASIKLRVEVYEDSNSIALRFTHNAYNRLFLAKLESPLLSRSIAFRYL